MNTFVMLGKYSGESFKGMSAERTSEAVGLINKYGGEVKDMYILLGDIDLLLIVTFGSLDQVIKASIALTKLTGISFSTTHAVTVKEFDTIIGKM